MTDRELAGPVEIIGARTPEQVAEEKATARSRKQFFKDMERDGQIAMLISLVDMLGEWRFSEAEDTVVHLIGKGVLDHKILNALRANNMSTPVMVAKVLRDQGRPKNEEIAERYDKLMKLYPVQE